MEFLKRECSNAHKEAPQRLITAPEAWRYIGEMLNPNLSIDKEEN